MAGGGTGLEQLRLPRHTLAHVERLSAHLKYPPLTLEPTKEGCLELTFLERMNSWAMEGLGRLGADG